jgi:hypothetical protein
MAPTIEFRRNHSEGPPRSPKLVDFNHRLLFCRVWRERTTVALHPVAEGDVARSIALGAFVAQRVLPTLSTGLA